MMLLATLALDAPMLVLLILAGYFIVLNMVLFRKSIFSRRRE